ncbi:MAG: transmembrane Mn(2+) transporter [Planctomycetia bacterium]|nr:transmembrane Mn(2+) transporter [Planctomycetia bacterium]
MIRSVSAPPPTLLASLAHLGPGIILASSIVGSGELIAATTVGAEAGFVLLWLIVIGCAIKVAAQVEIGRTTLTWGRTPLAAFDAVPGPRLAGRGWIYWGWAAMTVLIVVQQGGILVGVAQTLSGGLPVTTAGRHWNAVHDDAAAARIAAATAERRGDAAEADRLRARFRDLEAAKRGLDRPVDGAAWAVVVAAVTSGLLAVGRYRVIEWLSILLVGGFTLVTLSALVMLQFDPAWAISGGELASGLVPSIPPPVGGRSPLVAALATFGIIGVGAAELMFYPYWCLEKGFGRAVGPRDDSPAWAARARGWLRVLQLDAWASMVVYTTVTVAFYLLGAATLGRIGILPAGDDMVRSLGAMYAPVFGPWAHGVFLVGAFCVLYSTLFAAADGNARIVADGLVLAGAIGGDDGSRRLWTRRIAVAWPLVALAFALAIRAPVAMVLASGMAQAVMLGALAVAVLCFRYRDVDPRLVPSRWWDVLLWLSCLGFVVVGVWTVWQKVAELVRSAG